MLSRKPTTNDITLFEDSAMDVSKNPFAAVLDKLLIDIMDCTSEAGIEIWLECGTLLGAVRDEDYIPWETDLDFGTRSAAIGQTQLQDFKVAIEARGYVVMVYASYWHIEIPGEECHADVNLYTIVDNALAIVPLKGCGNSATARMVDSLIRVVDQKPLGLRPGSTRMRDIWRVRLQKAFVPLPKGARGAMSRILRKLLELLSVDTSWRVPVNLISKCQSRLFRNVTVHVPVDAERYLALRYGNDWRVPRRIWDTWKQDGTVVVKCQENS